MQYQRAFSYQFDDPQWPTKLGWATLISLVPILNFALAGYTVGIIRNLSAGSVRPLPHWDDISRKFTDGLLLALAGLVYSAPVFVVLAIPVAVLAASGALSGSTALQDWGRVLQGAGWLVLACVASVVILYTLVLSIIRPVILVIFSREGTFASCFRLRDALQLIRGNARSFFTIWLAVILASIGVGLIVGFLNLVIGWIPCIGWAAGLVLGLGSAIYLLTVDAYLFGQFRLVAYGGQPPILPADDAKSQQNPGDLSS